MLYVLNYKDEVVGVYNNLSKLVKSIEVDMENMEASAENYAILALDENHIFDSEDIPEYSISTGIRVLDEEGDIIEVEDDYDDDNYED